MIWSAVVVALALGSAPALTPGDTPVHLGVSLRVAHPAELRELERAQQDPASPSFRRWLTPAEFGARFGQPEASYRAVARWLQSEGFRVTESPNRIFIEGVGTAEQASRLFGVHLRRVAGQPVAVHVPDGILELPDAIAPLVLHVAGVDSRVRHRHHIASMTPNMPTMGPQDIRRFYDSLPVLAAGHVGQDEELVVLGDATSPGQGPDPAHIQYFFENVSDSSATFVDDVMPNPSASYYPGAGASTEFELDPEMQSVGAPGAASITLVQAPASEVFTTGANYVVTQYAAATSVSLSLGACEPNVEELDSLTGTNEATAMQQLVTEGVMQGQSWFASSGDTGVDACGLDNLSGGDAGPSVDFPASIPEMVAVGGTEIPNPTFDGNQALAGYDAEAVWDDLSEGAGGGGLSVLFTPAPAYQQGLGLNARGVPDIALIAGLPGVGVSAQPPSELAVVQGTSVAAPLSAGFFALMASQLGCRLGDVHAELYALGAAQAKGATGPFHDVTSGNNGFLGVAGEAAGPGYDLATGWGSLDVAKLAAAWTACPAGGDGGPAGAAYDACAAISCAAASCTTLTEGPSTCAASCAPASNGCATGNVCTVNSIYASGGEGSCIPGCATDADCAGQDAGSACSYCNVCTAPGDSSASFGDNCSDLSQCPAGGSCYSDTLFSSFTGGFCTQTCGGTSCSCPAGSVCSPFEEDTLCVETCSGFGATCARPDFLCQPLVVGGFGCTPACQILFGSIDDCILFGSNNACDVSSGVCNGPPLYDLGDGGAMSSSSSSSSGGGSSGSSSSGSSTTTRGGGSSGGSSAAGGGASGAAGPAPKGTPTGQSGGCGCGSAGGSPAGLLLAALAGWALRRRRTSGLATQRQGNGVS